MLLTWPWLTIGGCRLLEFPPISRFLWFEFAMGFRFEQPEISSSQYNYVCNTSTRLLEPCSSDNNTIATT